MGDTKETNGGENIVPTPWERERAERDFALKESELTISREELAIKKHELKLKEEDQRYSRWLNPVFLGLAAATLTLLGNIYVTHQQSKAATEQEETRSKNLLLQARAKAQSDLILEAIKTGDTTKAANNLEFFVKLGFIDDPDGRIAAYLSSGKDIPVLPSSSGATHWGASNTAIFRPVSKLAPDSTQRLMSNSVGMVRYGQGSCTAWLVASDLIITADYCVAPDKAEGPPVFVLGYLSAESKAVTLPVSSTPVEIDRNLGYAILKLTTSVDKSEHPPLRLATREPTPGESIFLLHHPEAGPMQISADADECKVVTVSPTGQAEFSHSCATVGGSSGAPIIAASDFSIIGIHYGKDVMSDVVLNRGRKTSVIRKSSKVLNAH
jgi:hypothetical protein